MEVQMGDVPDKQEANCDIIYQGGLYIITAIMEAVLMLTLIFMTYIIKNYIQCKKFYLS